MKVGQMQEMSIFKQRLPIVIEFNKFDVILFSIFFNDSFTDNSSFE